MDNLDAFISKLYRYGSLIRADNFREWALLQMREMLPFDAAIWGNGALETVKFHNETLIGLPDEYPRMLEQTSEQNPFWTMLKDNMERPVNSIDVMPDDEFYNSEVYQRAFKPSGIERVLATLHHDPRSGLICLLSLYRCDRNRPFSREEEVLQQRLVTHLVQADSHAFFNHLSKQKPQHSDDGVFAVCDHKGYLHEVQPQFLDLLSDNFSNWNGPQLPFEVPSEGEFAHESLRFRAEPLGDLVTLEAWEQGPLDLLTDIERQIVDGISRGLSFKEIARITGRAPSTVSNNLYRIYRKLDVTNRTSLLKLIRSEAQDG